MFWSWLKGLFSKEKTIIRRSKYDFVAIDFETANNSKSSICSCGVVAIKDANVVAKKHFLIRPNVLKFNKRNTQIHGIKREDVINQPTFDIVWPEIKEYINGEMVVAHNASFDLNALKAVLDAYHLEYPELEYVCSVYLAKKTIKDTENHKLNTLAKHFSIPLNHHDALSDAEACATVVCRICEQQGSSLREVALDKQVKIRTLTPSSPK